VHNGTPLAGFSVVNHIGEELVSFLFALTVSNQRDVF